MTQSKTLNRIFITKIYIYFISLFSVIPFINDFLLSFTRGYFNFIKALSEGVEFHYSIPNVFTCPLLS